jgi:predicted transcriptional regulator
LALMSEQHSRRASGELEALVMNVLWAAPGPLTPAQVQQGLGGKLAYNTVQTILSRLADKQVVIRSAAGRAHTYTPARTEAEATAAHLRAALSATADPAGVLQQFAASLEPGEAQLLRELLASEQDKA